jgi:hypothetical protein
MVRKLKIKKSKKLKSKKLKSKKLKSKKLKSKKLKSKKLKSKRLKKLGGSESESEYDPTHMIYSDIDTGDVPQAMLKQLKIELPYDNFIDYTHMIDYMLTRSQSFNNKHEIPDRKALLCYLVPIFKTHFDNFVSQNDYTSNKSIIDDIYDKVGKIEAITKNCMDLFKKDPFKKDLSESEMDELFKNLYE